MSDDKTAANETPVPTTEDGIPLFANGRRLTEQEIDILREARARREAIDNGADMPKEVGGGDRKAEPTRYGDWEKDGRAYDFS